jgi:hypothetical protein
LDGIVDLLGKLPGLASALGEMLKSPWTVAGLMMLLAGGNYWLYYRANRALLAEKDARLGDVKETAKLADQMRDVLALLGRKAESAPPPDRGKA